MDTIHIGTIIRYLRKERNLTQTELAENICSRKYIILLEQGKYSPSSYILEKLSSRLKTNIHSFYLLVYKHKTLETHLKIQHINELISKRQTGELRTFLSSCSNDINFQDGEPLQIYYYAMALCSSNEDTDYIQAIEYLTEGLKVNHEDFNASNFYDLGLSNIELLLINGLAVNYYRLQNYDQSLFIYSRLLTYLNEYTMLPAYTIHSNYHFEINLFCNVIYNMTSVHIELGQYTEALPHLDKAIELCKRLSYSNSLYSLVKNKLIVQYNLNDISNAKKSYQHILVLSSYDRMDESVDKIQEYMHTNMPLLFV